MSRSTHGARSCTVLWLVLFVRRRLLFVLCIHAKQRNCPPYENWPKYFQHGDYATEFKLVAALLRVAGVTAGLAESNGRQPPGLWITSPADWLQRTGISSGTLCSVIEYGLPLPFFYKQAYRPTCLVVRLEIMNEWINTSCDRNNVDLSGK